MTGQMQTYVPKGREAEALMVGEEIWFVIDAEGQGAGGAWPRTSRVF